MIFGALKMVRSRTGYSIESNPKTTTIFNFGFVSFFKCDTSSHQMIINRFFVFAPGPLVTRVVYPPGRPILLSPILNWYTGVSNSTLSTGPFALSLLIYITAVYLAQVGLFFRLLPRSELFSLLPVTLRGWWRGLREAKVDSSSAYTAGGEPYKTYR